MNNHFLILAVVDNNRATELTQCCLPFISVTVWSNRTRCVLSAFFECETCRRGKYSSFRVEQRANRPVEECLSSRRLMDLAVVMHVAITFRVNSQSVARCVNTRFHCSSPYLWVKVEWSFTRSKCLDPDNVACALAQETQRPNMHSMQRTGLWRNFRQIPLLRPLSLPTREYYQRWGSVFFKFLHCISCNKNL